MEKSFITALEKGSLSEAADILKRIEKDVPRTRFLFLEGLLLEKEGELEEASKKFDMALVLHLSDNSLWKAKARVLMELGKVDMAKRAVERACRLKPDDHDGHLLLSEILYRMKDYPRAEKEIDMSLELGGRSAAALTLKGILISILKQDYRSALTYFDSAIDTDEGYGRAWTNRGIALKEIGDRDGSIYSFQKGLIIDPEDSNAKKMLIILGQASFVEKMIGRGPKLNKRSGQDEKGKETKDELEELDEWEDWGGQ